MIGLVGLLCCTTVVASAFRQKFADLLEGRSLPALTHVFLSIPGPVYVLCVVGAIVGLVWKESRISDKHRTLIMNVVAFITLGVLFGVLVVALFMPLINIVSLQK